MGLGVGGVEGFKRSGEADGVQSRISPSPPSKGRLCGLALDVAAGDRGGGACKPCLPAPGREGRVGRGRGVELRGTVAGLGGCNTAAHIGTPGRGWVRK